MNKRPLLLFSIIISLCSCSNINNNESNDVSNSYEEMQEISGSWKSFLATKDNIKNIYNKSVTPFNTVMQMNYFLEDSNKDNNDKLFEDVTTLYDNEVGRLHKLFDRHNKYYVNENKDLLVNINVINDSFGKGEAIKCDDDLYNLLKHGIECYKITNGQFNMFTGALTNYWDSIFNDFYGYHYIEEIDPYFVPAQKEKLEKLLDAIPSNLDEINAQLTFDDENKTVTFNKCDFNNDSKPLISVGGIAKGFATDIIKQKLIDNNYLNAYLISGGSSLSSVSKPIYSLEQGGQKISVINPEKSNIIEKEVAFTIKIKDEFNFSTSGNYTAEKWYRFMDENGNLIYRHHIINPFTGYPESYHRSVSIYTTSFSNAYVDAFTTAFMNLSIEDGLLLRKEILNKYPDSDLELLYLTQEGYESKQENKTATYTVIATSNFNNTLTLQEGVNIVYEK